MSKSLVLSLFVVAVVAVMLAFAPASQAADEEQCMSDCAAQYEDCAQQCGEDKDCISECEQSKNDCENSCQSN